MLRLLLSTLVILLFCPMMVFSQPELRAMTFNIRLNTSGDGENAWPYRKAWVGDLIRFHQADLLGVQEALPDQMADLKALLPEYQAVGIGRDTIAARSEYSAIFFRKSRFTLLDSATFWLSESPDRVSTGWDAALPRIVTWAKLQDRMTGQVFFHFNTHFDHVGKVARRNSALLIRRKIGELNTGHLPVILTGDFNARPADEPIQALLEPGAPHLQDAHARSVVPPYGPDGTWSAFKVAGEPGNRIDYVFVNPQVGVIRHHTLTDARGPKFPSDHLPVLAELVLSPPKSLPSAFAHNDYAHSRPLFEALEHGFSAVEADVWWIQGQMTVAHDRPLSIQPERSLEALYLQPLAQQIHRYGSVRPGEKDPVWLMIDIKSDGTETYAALKQVLQPYAWMFQGENAPVRLFLSGARPADLMLADAAFGWIGIDGRPGDLGKGIFSEKMPVISTSYGSVLNWKGKGQIPGEELEKLKKLVSAAHREGKKVRLWACPESKEVWDVLRATEVDFLNADDLGKLKNYLLGEGSGKN